MSDHQKNANVSQDSLKQSSVKKTNHANHGEQEIFVPNNVSVSSGAGQMLRAKTGRHVYLYSTQRRLFKKPYKSITLHPQPAQLWAVC